MSVSIDKSSRLFLAWFCCLVMPQKKKTHHITQITQCTSGEVSFRQLLKGLPLPKTKCFMVMINLPAWESSRTEANSTSSFMTSIVGTCFSGQQVFVSHIFFPIMSNWLYLPSSRLQCRCQITFTSSDVTYCSMSIENERFYYLL